MFVHHLANLPITSLARNVFDLQESNSLSGLLNEVQDHLSNLNFKVNRHSSKWSWKKQVKEYILTINRNELLEDSKMYKKVNYENLVNEDFKRKNYFF